MWRQRLGHIDPDRLRIAFDSVEESASRWPTPAAIKEALPTYEHTYKPAPIGTLRISPDPDRVAESKARVQQMIDQLASSLGANRDAL